MSAPILPYDPWQSGTNENSIPANTNNLRDEIFNGYVISDAVTAQPGSPLNGAIYIIPVGATGTQWATFDADDLTIFYEGTWTAFAPVDGIRVNLAGTLVQYAGSSGYVPIAGSGSGDVVGPSSSTDKAVARYDGTTGKLLQNSGVLVGDNNEISGYRGNINAQTGTTYTLVSADTGKIVELTNGSAITLTLPNSLPVGFCCTLTQGGAGQVTLSAASGATLRNRQSHTKIAGQWGGATLYVRANSGGSAAEYVLLGDTAT